MTWEVPVEKKKTGSETQSISIINLENYKCRKVVENMTELVKLCITDEERQQTWLDALQHYNKCMPIMCKKGTNYTRDEIDAYEFHAD